MKRDMFPIESLLAALANVLWGVDLIDADTDDRADVVRLGTYIAGLRDGYLDGWLDRQRM